MMIKLSENDDNDDDVNDCYITNIVIFNNAGFFLTEDVTILRHLHAPRSPPFHLKNWGKTFVTTTVFYLTGMDAADYPYLPIN